ncbi:hypothetical protein CHARACLAT_005548 [Characodon lateralis]|uniref:Uncharacterized protein n=1 Tax=Characodon lateralis TaxID=208331 RepID=A0ABU7EAI0_9TELE|nr:hypothetical protein [Characodon lateralis]
MAPLPGVVKQNMADFHCDPLDLDTVQLSLHVCSENQGTHKHSLANPSEIMSECNLPLPKKKKALRCVAPHRGKSRQEQDAVLLALPPANILLFLNSLRVFIIIIFFTEAIHSSADSVTSVSCRPGGVSPSNNRHTCIFTPQPVE